MKKRLPKYLIAGFALVVALSLVFVPGCRSEQSGSSEEGWTCGMHPQVRSEEPGDCPICGMDLIRVKSGEPEHTGDEEAPRMIELTADQMYLAKAGTATVEKRELQHSVKTTGTVEFDERALATVSARFAGRIERLYVNFQGAVVSYGSPLAEIYSPELAAAQQEYLSALTSLDALPAQTSEQIVTNARALVNASKERLRLWGITDAQIAELERTGSPRYTMTVVAPQSGTVTRQHVVEGSYVKTGQPLFEIGNPRRVWIQAAVYEQDISSVKLGQHAAFSLPGNPSQRYEGEVTFIARNVEVGPAADGYYPVISGLSEGEKVVARGAFLIDSETRITGGSSALYGGASEVKTGAGSAPAHQH